MEQSSLLQQDKRGTRSSPGQSSSGQSPRQTSALGSIYGTIQSKIQGAGMLETPGRTHLACLASRGSVMGILNDVSLNMGGYVVLCFTMLLNLPNVRLKLETTRPCMGDRDFQLHMYAVTLCQYCEVYVLCFPLMAFTITLLMVGRDVLHKRFYYRLLLEGGVLRYRSHAPMSDVLILMSIWSFIHVCVYACLLTILLFHLGVDPKRALYTAYEAMSRAMTNPNSPASGLLPEDAVAKSDPEGYNLLVLILVFVIVPGIFYLIFLFRSYEIERTLVPLSEYIMDFNNQRSAEELGKLVVMEEVCLKAMVEQEFDNIMEATCEETLGGQNGQKRYVEAIKRYDIDEWNDLFNHLHSLRDPSIEASPKNGEEPSSADGIGWRGRARKLVSGRIPSVLQRPFGKDIKTTKEEEQAEEGTLEEPTASIPEENEIPMDKPTPTLTLQIKDKNKVQVDLLDSLWPAAFVLTEAHAIYDWRTGKVHYFVIVWFGFLVTCLVVGLSFLATPVRILYQDVEQLLADRSYKALVHVAATFLHLAIAVLILHRLCKATPAWSYMHCCKRKKSAN